MPKRALLVGIDQYDNFQPPLDGCARDAEGMAALLRKHEDGSPNYSCRVFTSEGPEKITRKFLRKHWLDLLGDFEGDTLFYFSGHGTPTHAGGVLVTQDGEPQDYGLLMSELLTLANNSKASSVLLILDCCHSGHMGNDTQAAGLAQLREGVTILAASRSKEKALEIDGHGLFTRLVLGALQGGAADVRGRVSAAAVYAYVEQILGDWDQRPMYKSHADHLPPLRLCKAAVEDELLRELPTLFPEVDERLRLDRSYEFSEEAYAQPDKVAVFNKLKRLRDARLLAIEDGKDLYFAALEERQVYLTLLGQFYWQLAKRDRLER